MQRVAKQYLVKTGRTVVITVPKAAPAERRPVMRTRHCCRSSLVVTGDAAAGVATSAAGQTAPGGQAQPPSSAGLVVKGKAPVSNDILKVKLPKPQEADLPNGLHLMVLEDHRLPRVSFQIIIPGAGGYFDPPAMIGLSTLHRADDARGHDDEVVAADLAGARDDVGQRQRRQRRVRDRLRRSRAAR